MCLVCGAFVRKTLAVAMSNGERDFVVVGSARRRRERRLRCFLRHEEMAIRMALARATHHAFQCHQCTQTLTSPAATYAATPAPSTVIEYVVPAPSVTYTAPAPVIEYVVPAPVIEYIAPSPAVSYPSPGLVNPQLSLTADETSQVQVVAQATPEISVAEWIQEQSAVTDLVKPQISIIADEASQVVGSSSLLEEFDALADVTTLNTSSTSTSSSAPVRDVAHATPAPEIDVPMHNNVGQELIPTTVQKPMIDDIFGKLDTMIDALSPLDCLTDLVLRMETIVAEVENASVVALRTNAVSST